MKNNRTATQNKEAREAYHALVAARYAGKALANIGSTPAARRLVRVTREAARLDLEIAAHYPNHLYYTASENWDSETGKRPGLVAVIEDGEWITERFCYYMISELDEFVQFEYKAEFHRGHSEDNSLTYIGSTYAEDDNRKRKDAPSTSRAWRAARRLAQAYAEQYLIDRSWEEYGRQSITEQYGSWELDKRVFEEDGGYKVVFEYTESGAELLTLWFTENGDLTCAEDEDGDTVTPTDDERETAQEAVVEYLEEKIAQFRGR